MGSPSSPISQYGLKSEDISQTRPHPKQLATLLIDEPDEELSAGDLLLAFYERGQHRFLAEAWGTGDR